MVIMTDLLTLSSLVFVVCIANSFLSFPCFLFSDFCLMFFFSLPIFPALPVCTGWSSRSPAVEKKLLFPVMLKGVALKEASQHVHAIACW